MTRYFYTPTYKMACSAVFGHMSYIILLVPIRRDTGQQNTTKIVQNYEIYFFTTMLTLNGSGSNIKSTE